MFLQTDANLKDNVKWFDFIRVHIKRCPVFALNENLYVFSYYATRDLVVTEQLSL